MKENIGNFFRAFLFAIAALAGIIVATLTANLFKDKQPVPVQIVPNSETNVQVVFCPNDFSGYEALPQDQVVKLINKKIPAYAANGMFVNPTIVIAKRGGEGSEVACGYLYIKAGTKDVGPLRAWENIYINPNPLASNPYGGHLIRDKAILSRDGESFTETLFSLDNINYRPDKNSTEIKSANWAALMNVSERIDFHISLNTEDRTGFIEEISIGYRCFNPQTGKETHDCRFEVVERRGL